MVKLGVNPDNLGKVISNYRWILYQTNTKDKGKPSLYSRIKMHFFWKTYI